VLLCGLYPRYRVDLFRQKLFELRDELFLFAADGGIEFSNPAYGMLRSTINGNIRFGHRLNLLEIILFFRFLGRGGVPLLGDSFAARWEQALSPLSSKQRERLESVRARMARTVAEHCIHMSPLLVVFSLLLALPIAILHTFARRLVTWIDARFGDRVSTAALIAGGS
jgi:hypothetical protein